MNKFKRLTATAIVLLMIFLLPLTSFAAAGDMPDAAATIEPQESETAAPEPTALPAPEESPLPIETPTPEETPQPEASETPVPEETPQPGVSESLAPEETPQPEASENSAPEETPQPEETQTLEPTEIPAPEETIFSDETNAYSDSFTYNDNGDGTVTIISYGGSETNVSVPAELDGKKVVAIEGRPNPIIFYQSVFGSTVTSVTLPQGLKTIGDGAFYKCYALTSVTIPDTVTEIGMYAFEYCTSLTDLNIPNGVKTIKDEAFYGCKGLKSITIPGSVTSIGNSTFYGCKGITSATIQNGVTSIGNSMFAYCTSLTSISIPNSVNSIGDYAFCYCTGLKTITIPGSVAIIGDGAFKACESLTNVNIPYGVKTINKYAFNACANLKKVTIDNSVTSIGNSAFSVCKSLTSINIPNGVKTIANGTFYGCKSLKSITIPGSVISIGDDNNYLGAFEKCSGLTNVTISNGVKSIGKYAFSECSSLTKIIIPSSVASIDYYALSGNTGLVIYCNINSCAYNYAKSHYIRYALSIPNPANFTSTVKTPTSAYMTWGAVSGVNGYEIWRSIGTGSYKLIKTNNASTRYLTDTTIVPGTTYNYMVRAYATVSGKKYYSGWAKFPNIRSALATPTSFTATVKSPTSAYMTWSSVPNVHGYEIWRSVGTGKYSLIRTNNASTRYFTDTAIVPGTTYNYMVRAYVTAGSKKYYSGWAKYPNIRYTISTPAGFKATVKSPTSTYLVWGTVSGATGYELYRSVNNGKSALVKALPANTRSFTDTKLTPGYSYTYSVRAYMTINGRKYCSGYAVCKNVKPTVGTPANLTGTLTTPPSANLTWSAVSGASGYELWRSANNGAYKLLKATTARSYNDKNLIGETTYGYKVRAYLTISGKKYYGDFTPIKAMEPTPKGQYKQVWVVDVPARVVEEPIYKIIGVNICNGCGFVAVGGDDSIGDHMEEHFIYEGVSYRYHSESREIKIGTKKTTIPEQGHYEQKWVQD